MVCWLVVRDPGSWHAPGTSLLVWPYALSMLTSAHSSTVTQLSSTDVSPVRAVSGPERVNLQSFFDFPSPGQCANPLTGSALQSQLGRVDLPCSSRLLSSLRTPVKGLRGQWALITWGQSAACPSYCSSLEPCDYAMLMTGLEWPLLRNMKLSLSPSVTM